MNTIGTRNQKALRAETRFHPLNQYLYYASITKSGHIYIHKGDARAAVMELMEAEDFHPQYTKLMSNNVVVHNRNADVTDDNSISGFLGHEILRGQFLVCSTWNAGQISLNTLQGEELPKLISAIGKIRLFDLAEIEILLY